MPDGINTSVDAVEPAGSYPAANRTVGQPQGAKLSDVDDAMLPPGDFGNPTVG